MVIKPATASAAAFHHRTSGRQLFVLDHEQGFVCAEPMIVEQDFEPSLGVEKRSWPRTRDLVLVGDREGLHTVASLEVRQGSTGGRSKVLVALTMLSLIRTIAMPPTLLKPRADEAGILECGRLTSEGYNCRMSGRLMLLTAASDASLRGQIASSLCAEDLQYI